MSGRSVKPDRATQREFLKRWLSNPELAPPEFESWLVALISHHPGIKVDRSSLPGLAGRLGSFGVSTVTWPGGANGSNYTTADHNVGTTPTVVIATNAGGPTGYCEVQTIGATTFQVRTVDPLAQPGNGTTGTVHWIAMA
jgi:hypothetical protein